MLVRAVQVYKEIDSENSVASVSSRCDDWRLGRSLLINGTYGKLV